MRINKLGLILLFISLVVSSCIDRYYVNSEDNSENKLVIEGTFTNEEKEQEIVISRSSSLESTKFNPVSGCLVSIEDEQKNKIILPESDVHGHYRATIDSRFARVGSQYRLLVETSNGKLYESSFEKMMPCPKVDSVYYELKTRPTSTIGVDEEGIQFFIDFHGDDTMGRFFRWSLQETYEYHSTWPVILYVDKNDSVRIVPEDYSNFVCYKSDPVDEIFALSTNGLVKNSYTKYPLHFVNNETQRLMYHYSLLTKQYSMSEGAYDFWENTRKNNKESVSLYGKQPSALKSNIYNSKDSGEIILGYFGVSFVNTKRINITNVSGLTFNKVFYCQAERKSFAITPAVKQLKGKGLDSIPKERPLYYYPFVKADGSLKWYWGDTDCFLCKLLGGVTERPLYWDEK